MNKQVVYYKDDRGHKPVLEFINSLPPDEQAKCFDYIGYLADEGEALRRPIADYLGGKLYELRPKQTRIIYFFMLGNYAILVHAFRKKTWGIPDRERQRAVNIMEKIMMDYQQGKIQFGGGGL